MRNLLRWLLGESSNSENRIALEDSLKALIEVRVLTEVSRLREYNRHDLKEIKNEQLRYWKALSLFLAVVTIILTVVMYEYDSHALTEKVNTAVNQEISTNLQTDINNVIAAKANPYIDKALLPFKSRVDDMGEKVKQVDFLSKNISTLNNTIKEANNASSNLQNKLDASNASIANLNQLVQSTNEQLGIVVAVIRADNDDKQGFDLLLKHALDPKSPYNGIAGEIITAIIGHLNMTVPMNPIPWQQMGVANPDSLTIDSIKTLYQNGEFSRADMKEGLQQYIWDNSKFKKYDKLEFFIWILANDKSISAVTYAQGLIDNEAHIKKNILGTTEYAEWWNKNKDQYKSTPPPSIH